MNSFIELITVKLENDRKIIIENRDFEQLYVFEMTKVWIERNVQSPEEFSERVLALGKILNSFEFQEALKLNREMYNSGKVDVSVCEKILSLILKLSKSEAYLENSPKIPYKIIDKFKSADAYKTDSFIVHANIVMRFWNYLCELEKSCSDS